MSANPADWFQRPSPERDFPERGPGHYYKAAASGGRARVAGIPLDSAEAAVTAAVRLAYKVAETQIDRSARLARRLRDAGDRATGRTGSERQALDATEQLIFRAIMAGLSWVEGAASDRGNPLKRLAKAEYRLLGSLLGLTQTDSPRGAVDQTLLQSLQRLVANDAPKAGRAVAEAVEEVFHRDGGPEPRQAAGAAAQSPRAPRIKHKKGSARRAVRVHAYDLAGDAAPGDIEFFRVESPTDSFTAPLAVGGKNPPTLTLTTSRSTLPGRWRAAICDEEGVQVGYIELEI